MQVANINPLALPSVSLIERGHWSMNRSSHEAEETIPEVEELVYSALS